LTWQHCSWPTTIEEEEEKEESIAFSTLLWMDKKTTSKSDKISILAKAFSQ